MFSTGGRDYFRTSCLLGLHTPSYPVVETTGHRMQASLVHIPCRDWNGMCVEYIHIYIYDLWPQLFAYFRPQGSVGTPQEL